MRMFGILDTDQGLSLDFLNNRVFYTMLMGALLFNYFYPLLRDLVPRFRAVVFDSMD